MTRKELTEAYKNMKFRAGVFQIRNLANNKVFVEGSSNLDKIWNRHLVQLKFGGHPNKDLQKDWATYGEANFVYEILAEIEESDDPDFNLNKEIKLLTAMYFDELQPFGEKGYHKKSENITKP